MASRLSALIGVALSCLLPCVAARAATVVVGSPLTLEFKSSVHVAGLFTTIANTELSEEGANVTSPVTGTIVDWRTRGTFTGGGFRVRVLRPVEGGNFIGAGASSFQTPVGTSLQTFPTELPIQAGDMIGLDSESKETGYSAEGLSGRYTLWSPFFPEGSSSPLVATGGGEVGFDAEVVPQPTLILIGPASGPLAGGTTVTIAGRELEGATAVKFGPNAASANFTVDASDKITAVSPPAAQPGTVDVTVTTPGGTSAPIPADQFTYTGSAGLPPQSCTVPRLIGKTLARARKRLTKAKCKLGKVHRVNGVTNTTGRVIKQTPKPGRVLPARSKVSIKLG